MFCVNGELGFAIILMTNCFLLRRLRNAFTTLYRQIISDYGTSTTGVQKRSIVGATGTSVLKGLRTSISGNVVYAMNGRVVSDSCHYYFQHYFGATFNGLVTYAMFCFGIQGLVIEDGLLDRRKGVNVYYLTNVLRALVTTRA